MVHQLVVGGAQLRVTGVFAQAGLIDQRLRVLDAEADGKGLGLDEHALTVQHAEGIARAVTQRQHHMAAGKGLAIGQYHALQLSIIDDQIGHLALEAYLATQGDDLLAHGGDHAGQAEGADVRFAHVHDFFRRAGADELVHHLAPVELRVLDLAVELAVGEQPRPALAELHVGFGRQGLLAPQRPGVLGAPAHILATLQHNRLEAHLRQQQRGEQTARAEADYQRPLGQAGRRLSHRVVVGVRCRANVLVIGQARQNRRLIAYFQIDDVDEQDHAVLLARIVAALEDGEVQQVCIGNTQALDDGLAQLIGGVIERQRQFVDANHGGNPGR